MPRFVKQKALKLVVWPCDSFRIVLQSSPANMRSMGWCVAKNSTARQPEVVSANHPRARLSGLAIHSPAASGAGAAVVS